MPTAERVRLQIRAVLVVYRSEASRFRAQADAYGREAEMAVRRRSLYLLDAARAHLDGQAAWHPELLAEIAAARREVAGEGAVEPPGEGG